jgi:hypothetical protein
MFSLRPGLFTTTRPDLGFRVFNEIPLEPGHGYMITGDNGCGKTTFLEKILLPALESCGHSYFYLGADLHMARAALVASLAFRRYRKRLPLVDPDLRERDSLTRLVATALRESGPIRAVILDEYPESIGTLLSDWTNRGSSVIAVTHQPDACRQQLQLTLPRVIEVVMSRRESSVSVGLSQ